MFKKTHTQFKNIFSGTKNRIRLVLALPVLLILIFSCFIVSGSYTIHKNSVIRNYKIRLTSFASETNAKISTLSNIAELTASNPDIKSFIANPEPTEEDLSAGTDAILSAEKATDIAESIAVYNKESGIVFSKTGIYDESKYFTSIYSYEKYPLEFWKSCNLPSETLNQLNASSYFNMIFSAQGVAIPFIYIPKDTKDTIVIININADKIYGYFDNLEISSSGNPRVYIYNNITSEISGKYIDRDSNISPLCEKAEKLSENDYDTAVINGKKYILLGSEKHFGTPGYSYILAVPQNLIKNELMPIFTKNLYICLALVVLLLLLFVWGFKTLYTPWKSLAEKVDTLHPQDMNSSSGKIEEYLISSFSSIVDINKELEQNLSVTLPLSQEKYLIDILNSGSAGGTEDFLTPLKFKYDYFISIAIEISVNPAYFGTTSITAGQMYRDLCKAIRALFSNHFVTYELPSADNVLYLLLNLENDACMDMIYETIKKINDIFALETDNVEFIFGVGNIYFGFDGLKLTHKEAISNMTKKINSRKIRLSSAADAENYFDESSRNILTGYFDSSALDKSEAFLKNILHDISRESFEKRREIYNNIISFLHAYGNEKGLFTDSFPYAEKNLSDIPEAEIKDYILSMPQTILNSAGTAKFSITEIVGYIDSHFTEDIYLEKLAQMYGTTTKYLSKKLKQELGMPFKDYITSLRIDKAKELLKNDSIKIGDLYTMVGFQNRSVFLRAFKLKTGLTPSDYKKNHS